MTPAFNPPEAPPIVLFGNLVAVYVEPLPTGLILPEGSTGLQENVSNLVVAGLGDHSECREKLRPGDRIHVINKTGRTFKAGDKSWIIMGFDNILCRDRRPEEIAAAN